MISVIAAKRSNAGRLCVASLVWLLLAAPLLHAAPQQGPAPQPSAASTQNAPEQPIPFSHKTHGPFHLACGYCHANTDPGNQIDYPATERCLGCHARVATGKPAIQKLAGYAQRKEAVPWKQVYSVPAFVYWSHRTHSDAKVGCEACHGDVTQMDVTAKVTNVTTMAGCVNCHRQKEAPTGCETCHESQSSLLAAPNGSYAAMLRRERDFAEDRGREK